ncbi:sn-glycerol-3-phosphate ABC transporter ATP-binding protein UgpC [Klebsiella oxytoca]|jgi:multiple sugar transport system ATP-binding protein|uniref:ABC transporter ATP-binding protein n=1 Tax=Klebsiella TaxID=570 RepID=UPI00115B548D|nr:MULTISPECIES: sn-glycerol-3-phosphate ABC transporter ATP-binding protein UgpC [Klebsiella]MBL5998017.1 sn-glycerol-3-phosphate ABC transporter ATP-binding protein UgpC [Klebsiella oxytoca]MBL6213878.1 sn-glycerol-3-phosphate ABC transporter ATP-binding protein UgpC [Klebsiella oxytoca]UHC74090.1 sn-glycerol-3-phosphate ABC transporter ATP-binding protein UgpC [Klebsiella oxytoca]UHC91171.1 sn-glycerol-3-phosphate ABC transporter ATP-binding protein UgpC [Klebsiella oxytoca]VUS83590.1 sn-gl
MATVSLRKIEKRYENGFKAVHGIDLEIHDGEFMVFVGPSGCAKSTTLRMIAGLEDISGGEIYIGNKKVNDLPPKDRGIAMVFQNYALYPHKTVFDNMAFGLKMQKRPKDEIKRRVEDAAEKLEITELLYRKPKEMSGGQRQRVAVGRAIVRKPDVFLFDEPLSNLDAKLRVSMRMKIAQLHRSLKEEGHPATMIYVTHDQTEALTLGDRICVLNHGNIMQVDTPTDLYNYPNNKFVASFIGSPSINLIDTAIRKNNERLYVEIAPGVEILIPHSKQMLLEGYINKPVCFGIRPEHISLASDDDDLNTFEGVLTVVENMGSEKFLYFIVGGKELIARVNTQDINPFHIGKTLRFNLNTAFCHVFDFYNENNLTNVRV